jgi:TATA-box binding protein (TBP) (component of TFIID and TFIIIB)
MNYLQWDLDIEESIDIFDPLGNLKIIGDEGKIIEDSTYLDAFFEALVEAAQKIKTETNISVDPIVEPNNLEFNCQKNTIKINYGQQQAIIFDKNKFIKDVGEAVSELLKILDEQSQQTKQPKRELIKLRNFIEENKLTSSIATNLTRTYRDRT